VVQKLDLPAEHGVGIMLVLAISGVVPLAVTLLLR
jgi:hypothetical protein